MDLNEAVCAACGKPLGIRANWHTANEGRAYHNDCPVPDPDSFKPPPVESLSEFVERKARSAMYGRGTRTLEQDARANPKDDDDGD